MNDAQKTGKVRTIGNVLAIAIHDLTKQGNFLYALFSKRTDLADNIANGTAAFDAALVGDDTEGAGM